MTKTHLYIVRQEGTPYVKIGISDNPKARLAQLQTSNPLPLYVVDTCVLTVKTRKGARFVETYVHNLMGQHWAATPTKGEWFEWLLGDDELTRYLNDAGALYLVESPQLMFEAPDGPENDPVNLRDMSSADVVAALLPDSIVQYTETDEGEEVSVYNRGLLPGEVDPGHCTGGPYPTSCRSSYE